MNRTGLLAEARDIGWPTNDHRRPTLNAGARRLARALAEPDADPYWPHRARELVSGLRRALAEHVQLTECAYAEVVESAPRLAHHVRQLMYDHAELTDALAVLHRCLDRPEASAAARSQAAGVLLMLARHRQRGADLLHAAYATDLGGET